MPDVFIDPGSETELSETTVTARQVNRCESNHILYGSGMLK